MIIPLPWARSFRGRLLYRWIWFVFVLRYRRFYRQCVRAIGAGYADEDVYYQMAYVMLRNPQLQTYLSRQTQCVLRCWLKAYFQRHDLPYLMMLRLTRPHSSPVKPYPAPSLQEFSHDSSTPP